MQVTSQWIDGLCFVGTTENGHSVVMEGAAAEGGVKRGPSPMEMLLLGVAGCSSIDVVMIAENSGRKSATAAPRLRPNAPTKPRACLPKSMFISKCSARI